MKKMKKNNKEIKLLCTLGPSSLNERTIARLDDIGVDIFRINLSHTMVKDLEKIIALIKQHTDKPICLDTEGAQIRTRYIKGDRIYLQENKLIEITGEMILGDANRISLSPDFIIKQIRPGDLIKVDFDSALLLVVEHRRDSIIAKVICEGYIGSNKAVNIDREINLPSISEKDKAAVKIGLKNRIRYFALSFADSKDNVECFRRYVGKRAHIISKIESKRGVENIDEILEVSDSILIDRGDLSREEPVEKVPFLQKLIVKKANIKKVPVYVATNLLESMVKSKNPTRAEMNDIANTLLDGADGLVLAAETAIGEYPVNCASMVSKSIKQFLDFSDGASLEELQRHVPFFLTEPHGGILVDQLLDPGDIDEIKKCKVLKVDKTALLDAEQIAIGAFSPLQGFMGKREVDSVLKDYRLPDGVVWPLPIMLQVNKEEADKLKKEDSVALALNDTAEIYAILHLEDIYTYDLDELLTGIFGTDDPNHPGIEIFRRKGKYFVSGKINLIKRLPSEYKHFQITPKQARAIFENKGWNTIVGFHTRNVVHRVHEYIQNLALERYHCDGLFIHPIVGPKKRDDFTESIILKSYELMINKYYPKGKVLLGAFQNYSRYAGPREAVFTALCRKNFGCSHFIVGRDHTGVKNYYGPNDAHKLFECLGDIGIEPIFFNEIKYCKKCGKYIEQCRHGSEHLLSVAGTTAREMLKSKKYPPSWLIREDISKLVLDEIKNGREVFV